MISEQCSLPNKHSPHEWDKGAFKRWCRGRRKAAK